MPELPKVALSGDDFRADILLLKVVGIASGGVLRVEHEVDLGGRKSDRLNLKLLADEDFQLRLK